MFTGSRQAPAAAVAVVFLTPRCNMSCPYCGSDAGFREFSRRDAWTLVEGLAAQGFQSVVFGGGEPTLWKGGLRELCAAARSRGLLTQVGTNALALPADFGLWREVDRWVIPLEAGEAAAHDRLRPCPGSHFARVMQALDQLSGGPWITVSSVARPDAEQDLEGLACLLEKRTSEGLRLHAWHLYRFQAAGRNGAGNAARFAQTDESWRALLGGLRQRHPRLPLLARPDMMHSRQVAFFWDTADGPWRQGPLDWKGPAERALPRPPEGKAVFTGFSRLEVPSVR